MTAFTRKKVILLMLATFVVGAVEGGFFVMGWAKDEMLRNRDPRRWFSNTPERWVSEMKLTPDQKEKIWPILREIDKELQDLRTLDLRETKGIFARGQDRIEPILRPDQRSQLHKAFEERERRVRDWLGVNDETTPDN